MKRIFMVCFSILLIAGMIGPIPARAAGVCYVNLAASGANNGTSWTNAYTDLQAAIGNNTCVEIWVVKGTYKPTSGSDRTISFALRNNLAIYGGFIGTETQEIQRNPASNVTNLSGDLIGDDAPFVNKADNSYHVVIGSNTSNSAVLDGFTIIGGNANGSAPYNVGGGMLNILGSPTLNNLRFANNYGGSGGGMYNEASSPALISVSFLTNEAATAGGGMLNSNASAPNLASVTFLSNRAGTSGAGMYNNASSPTLFSVTFTSNQATSAGGGMANLTGSNPSLSFVTFTSNTAPAGGGGMYNKASNPLLTNVTFNTNIVSGGAGGGMYNVAASPTLTNVTFSGNSSSASGGGMSNGDDSNIGVGVMSNPTLTNVVFQNNHSQSGGGLMTFESSGTLTNVTFVGNTASWKGAAMENHSSSPTFTNVTITGNTASQNGGGMYNYNSNPSLTNVTISGNSATTSTGGGIYNTGTSQPILKNTIVADSVNGGDCVGTVNPASTNNLIEDASNACGLIDGVDFVNSTFNLVGYDPILTGLANNGGYTQTMALNYGSYAIDTGTSAGAPSTDQRGVARPADGSNDGLSSFDIGAYEYIYQNATRYAIPSGGLTSGLCDSWANACTLKRAIAAAKSGDQVWVKAGTYTPDASDRTISFILKNNVSIYGGFAGTETLLSQRDPVANVTILSGDLNGDDNGNLNKSDNSYHVVVGSGRNDTARLDGFTIRGGYANGLNWPDYNGGGMLNYQGNPSLSNLTFIDNYASNGGGAMINDANSNLKLKNSTFSGNSAGSAGGGAILNWNATDIVFSNVTLVNNSTTANGGGLYNNGGSLTVLNATISDNSAVNGRDVYVNSGSVTITNTIISNSSDGGDCDGTVEASSKNNLIEYGSHTCGLTNGPNGNIIGLDPKLGALANNGGFTQTMAIPFGSPAVDAGDNTACADVDSVNKLDQRGKSRLMDGDANDSAICDIGSYEYQRTPLTATIRSNGAEDGWILETAEAGNAGGTMDSAATLLRIGDDAAKKQYRIVLSFNTSTLPDTAIITTVTLMVKNAGVVGGGNPIATFGGFRADIRKGTFGTAALQLADFKTAANQTVGPVSPSLISGWYSIDLTSAKARINQLATLSGLTQIRLRFNLDDNNNTIANYLKIYSGDAGLATRPKLIIQYFVP